MTGTLVLERGRVEEFDKQNGRPYGLRTGLPTGLRARQTSQNMIE